jgi:hypothetical protein
MGGAGQDYCHLPSTAGWQKLALEIISLLQRMIEAPNERNLEFSHSLVKV